MKTFEELGIRLKNPSANRQKTTCPECSPTRHNSSDPCLTVWAQDGNFKCHHCGWTGSIYTRDGNEGPFQPLHHLELNLPSKTIAYFKKRGISPETLSYFGVTHGIEWMFTAKGHNGEKISEGKRDTIQFNYVRNGQVVNTKFRDEYKSFKLTAGAPLILYNEDCIRGRNEIVITEGEIDAMSWYEAGYYGPTSVPNGAPTVAKGGSAPSMSYLDNSADAMLNKEKVYIATDNDEPGLSLRHFLINRIGRHKCWIIEYPEGCKDSNDVLIKHGPERLRQCMKEAIPPRLDQILTVDDVEGELDDIFENGYPEGYKTGFHEFDKHYSFLPRRVTTVTGISHHGKSDMVDQWMIRLAVRHAVKCGVFSPENETTEQVIKLMQKYAGQPIHKRLDRPAMSKDMYAASKTFVNKHFFFFDTDKVNMTIDGLLKKAEELVLRYGIFLFLIDPYNYIESRREKSQTETEYVSEIMGKLKIFAKKYNVHVILVAHPTKVPKDRNTGKAEIPNLQMISGSGNFLNKTDGGIVAYRNFDTGLTDVLIQKAKPFYVGKVGGVTWHYDVPTGLYAEDGKFRGEVNEVVPEPAIEIGEEEIRVPYPQNFPDTASSFTVEQKAPQIDFKPPENSFGYMDEILND